MQVPASGWEIGRERLYREERAKSLPSVRPPPHRLPPITPAGQGPSSGRAPSAARRTHLPSPSRCRSLWEPPSPQLPERKKDGGVCRETTHSSVWQRSGDSGSSALKQEEEEEDEEGTAQSDAICCTPLRSHWLPGASPEPRARAAGSHLAPHLPQQPISASPPPLTSPPLILLLSTSSAPFRSGCALSPRREPRAHWLQPRLLRSPRLFPATLKLWGVGATWRGDSPAGLSLGFQAADRWGQGRSLCASGATK